MGSAGGIEGWRGDWRGCGRRLQRGGKSGPELFEVVKRVAKLQAGGRVRKVEGLLSWGGPLWAGVPLSGLPERGQDFQGQARASVGILSPKAGASPASQLLQEATQKSKYRLPSTPGDLMGRLPRAVTVQEGGTEWRLRGGPLACGPWGA